MKLAPIVIFSYDRPDHLKKTLEALAKNNLAKESELFIYCDGAKRIEDWRLKNEELKSESERLARYKEYAGRVDENRKVAHSATGFKSVTVIEREKNIGLKANIIGAVTEIVNKYGRIITLEDDIVTSPGYLRFMNEALDLYKDDEQVMHISGYMWPHRWHLPETFFYELPYPGGGWATWARAWKYYNDDATELYHYWENRWDKFNTVGVHLQAQLYKNYVGTLNTWFIKWHAVLLQRGGLTLYPGKSLTNNIGFDSLATNCFESHKFDVVPVDSVRVKRKPIKESRLAANEIYAFYQGRWYNRRRRNAMFNRIKNFICFWK